MVDLYSQAELKQLFADFINGKQLGIREQMRLIENVAYYTSHNIPAGRNPIIRYNRWDTIPQDVESGDWVQVEKSLHIREGIVKYCDKDYDYNFIRTALHPKFPVIGYSFELHDPATGKVVADWKSRIDGGYISMHKKKDE